MDKFTNMTNMTRQTIEMKLKSINTMIDIIKTTSDLEPLDNIQRMTKEIKELLYNNVTNNKRDDKGHRQEDC